MDLTEGSETSAIINQTPGNYPKESLLHSVHGESLKSKIKNNVSPRDIVCPENMCMDTLHKGENDIIIIIIIIIN